MPNSYTDDLAWRLCAAFYSHRLRYTGVDYALKNYVERDKIGDYWRSLAAQVERDHMTMLAEEISRYAPLAGLKLPKEGEPE